MTVVADPPPALSRTRAVVAAGSWLLLAWPAAAGDATPGVQIGFDVDGNGIVRLDGHGDPRLPIDRTTIDRPYLFWLNADQDDLDYYESWPIERPDHDTDGADSPRDLEDFTRLVVQLDATLDWAGLDGIRLRAEPIEGELSINLYRAAERNCSGAHMVDAGAARRQLLEPWNVPVGRLEAGRTLEIEIGEHDVPGNEGRWLCFLFEGRREGTAGIRIELLRGGQLVAATDPAWLSIRHVKRMMQRVDVPWPEDRPYAFEFLTPPPPVELEWRYDPQGYPFEPPWHETDDVIVWVYGWLKSGPGLYEMATVKSGETVFKRLWHRGYRGRLVLFHWPTVKEELVAGLLRSEYRGYKVGRALADHVASYPADKRVHVTAHSLGGVPLLEALRLGMRAEHALFQVSAVPAEALDADTSLHLPEAAGLETPTAVEEGGYAGYLPRSETRIYSLYNPIDTTFRGWNIAQKTLKGGTSSLHKYQYRPQVDGEGRLVLRHGTGERPVTDPDEARAFITRSRTQALGAEPRVRGVVHSVYDLHRPPYEFGSGHVVQWAWEPQRTTGFYNLVLDLFNIRYNSERL